MPPGLFAFCLKPNRIAYVDLAGIGSDMMEDDTPWEVIIGDGKIYTLTFVCLLFAG
jgi:hypothetical protein